MRKSRHPSADREELLASIENLQQGGGEPQVAPPGELAQALLLLAERIAETVAARLAEDLLALPTEEEEAERRRG